MGFFEKIITGLTKTRNNITAQLVGMFDSFTGANEDFFEELEETLIMADLGAQLATDTVEQLRQKVKKEGIRGAQDIKDELGPYCPRPLILKTLR
jgi:fused signal recognition particle receptor